MTAQGGLLETLEDVPAHVWKGLPEDMSLKHSAVNQNRIGVWASRLIPKGKRFGPFVGERKKRSQVTSNVYMWEVYFPALGWMCVDATDPAKGNWLRYVNWARSTQEQNLFPLEINRAIYYKVLKPIGPGEELLVWYNGEDNPEIAAAIEEERVSSLGKRSSPRARRARRKLLERARARQAGLGGFRSLKQARGAKLTLLEMQGSDDGLKAESEGPSPTFEMATQDSFLSAEPSQYVNEDTPPTTSLVEEPEEQDLEKTQQEPQVNLSESSSPAEAKPVEAEEQSCPESGCQDPEEEVAAVEQETASISSALKLEPEPDCEDDSRGESHFPCQHCERHFTTKQGLERHVHIHVAATRQTHTFKCRYCSKPFGSQIGRRRHERRHENGSKKKLGSLSGTSDASPSLATDSSSPDLIATSGQVLVTSESSSGPPESSVADKQGVEKEQRAVILDEKGELKELYPCKYCKKAFGTHTNMRRHQRRIHERHLLPKGVRRKGMLLQEGQPQQPAAAPEKSPSTSPHAVYLPSGDVDDERDQDEDYMIDISSNISENLSFYIDGKILSTSTVSTCEVVEVDSNSASMLGLDAVIISSDKTSQAVKVETTTCTEKEITNAVQSAAKRRTSTPPLLPKIKTEALESDAVSSASSSSSASSLAGGLCPQATDSLAFQKERTVYLSPKLKQLLQTQDNQKPNLTQPEANRLIPPAMSVAVLPAASGRFKRRTSSPPTSPQLSPEQKGESAKSEGSLFSLKVPKVEGQCMSPIYPVSSKGDRDTMSPTAVDAFKVSPVDWPSTRSGGSSCNQQPLDLSGAVGKRIDGQNKGPGEAVLDLSMQRKTSSESETKALQPLAKKRKPNTSMLEKVLMNEYASLDSSVEDVSSLTESPRILSTADTVVSSLDISSTDPESLQSESALHPPPPSLTPVIMNPPSPHTPTLASPTPPPPVLPTVPSPLAMSPSPSSQLSNSPRPRPLPILSPETSPRPAEFILEGPSQDSGSNDSKTPPLSEVFNAIADSADLTTQSVNLKVSPGVCTMLIEPMIFSDNAKPSSPDGILAEQSSSPLGFSAVDDMKEASQTCSNSGVTETTELIDSASAEVQHSAIDGSSDQSVILLEETDGQDQPLSTTPPHSLDPPVLVASLPESPLTPVTSESPPTLVLPPPLVCTVINDEIKPKDEPVDVSEGHNSAATDQASDEESCELEMFCKNFICNVCENPFPSIKELSQHIMGHALEWPFKCEFCIQLFGNAADLLEHRSALHSVGRIFICCVCSKEFAFLCNLLQHQKDLHPGHDCTHTVVENGKLRPQNYTDPTKANTEQSPSDVANDSPVDCTSLVHLEALKAKDWAEEEPDDSTEELYTTIKIMASEGGKPKGPDVRLGINQHYPSFKPPPFPYHNRTPAGSVASATNFTTHNIPQTFSTAIRCTKCGKSFDNMPELHKHILACASASDKKRYTPKKNPIPLRQIAKPQNGAPSPLAAANGGQITFRRMGQPKRLTFSQESSGKVKLSALSKKKNQLVQKAISQRNKSTAKKAANSEAEQEVHVCPHCRREFTYLGSLNKHVAVSCPMKPVSKKVRKGAAEALTTQDRNTSLRRRTADVEIKQQGSDVGQKTLGKTRARSSGPADGSGAPLKLLPSKGRMAASQAPQKRLVPLQAATLPFSKKSKKSGDGQIPHPPGMSPTSSAERLVMRMQRGGKAVLVQSAGDGKSQQLQPKKDERFSMKVRERVGGPVTRSLQLANTTSQMEVKAEELSSPESRETQESLLKLAG
ncbi:PR domain zinc finger protein 2 isoform X1 [Brienomyrus brachyistius]|uniref:PR domain zinc finger protein 2 isoform X1 n=2 Tax=Brienomyrus brachyistius TaxID=42636 RepID=UPI0020B2BE37|nr:PR domain zinc finger protein 2 isoform X1 [Brienomyrus brachyistius]XP_048879225.1 PR domain zinc finger protein 2 isoform X1 [Brienomyrus brachyistius]